MGLHNLVFEFRVSSGLVDALLDAYLRSKHWKLKNSGRSRIPIEAGASYKIEWWPRQWRLLYSAQIDKNRWTCFEIFLGEKSKGKVLCKLGCSRNPIKIMNGGKPSPWDLIITVYKAEELFRRLLMARGLTEFYVCDFTRWILRKCELNRDGKVLSAFSVNLLFEKFSNDLFMRIYLRDRKHVRAEVGGPLNLSFSEFLLRILAGSCKGEVATRIEGKAYPIILNMFFPYKPYVVELEDGRTVTAYIPREPMEVKQVILTSFDLRQVEARKLLDGIRGIGSNRAEIFPLYFRDSLTFLIR